MNLFSKAVLVLTAVSCILTSVSGEQCGQQAGGALCPNGLCCSKFGWCGSTDLYCGADCQSQCSTGATPTTPVPVTPAPVPVTPSSPSGGAGVGSIITQEVFEEMLKHRNDDACQGHGFYTYDAFIAAAGTFGGFGTTGDDATQKRELAAFFAQTSHETTGGWPTAPDGTYAWGYCFVKEQGSPPDYCVASGDWPCAPGQKYFGRGPIQLSYNYNYGPAGKAIGSDLINNPDLVSTDPTISFKTALWFWMTPQANKPSSHEVITGSWAPSADDTSAGRVPGFGVITNIINGGVECGKGQNDKADNRVGFYSRYCSMLGVDPGSNLDCNNQKPFAL